MYAKRAPAPPPIILAAIVFDLYIIYVPIAARYMKKYTLNGTINTLPNSTQQEAILSTVFVAVLENGERIVSLSLNGGNVYAN